MVARGGTADFHIFRRLRVQFNSEESEACLMTTREAVLLEAESWLGTPFEHLQRCKGAGTDCGQYLLGVYYNVKIIPYVAPEYYPRDFHLHSNREWYMEIILRFAKEIPGPPNPGDLALFKLNDGLVYSHGAIVTSWPKVIHAFIHRGVVRADAMQGYLKGNPVKFFEPLAFSE
jgi:cell wall-associated NlpC family hydrolase